MPIRDLIETGEIYKCGPDDSLGEAVKKMKDHNVGAILVVENDRPVGIVTDRDIALRVVGGELDYKSLSLRDVMTPSIECVPQDSGVQDVLRIMKDRQVRRIPVVDSEGKATGLLSSDDLLRLFAKEMGDLTEAVVPYVRKGRELKSA